MITSDNDLQKAADKIKGDWKAGLPASDVIFIDAYLSGKSLRESEFATGYHHSTPNGASCAAKDRLRSGRVKAAIEQARVDYARFVGIEPARVWAELLTMLDSDPADLFDADGKPKAMIDIPADARKIIKRPLFSKSVLIGYEVVDRLSMLDRIINLMGRTVEAMAPLSSMTESAPVIAAEIHAELKQIESTDSTTYTPVDSA